jgi:hypothetical protein
MHTEGEMVFRRREFSRIVEIIVRVRQLVEERGSGILEVRA